MKILAWDIETRPLLVHTWGLFNQNVSLGQLVESTEVMCFAARWVGEPRKDIVFRSTHHHGVGPMRDTAWELLDQADALLSWNGKAFDTKHVRRELLLGGYPPPSPVKEIDLLQTARSQFKFTSNKLDHVAQELGVGKKKVHEGFGLWLKCMMDDPAAWERMRRYNEQDVHLLIRLYDRLLPWITNHPNRALYDGVMDGCYLCGAPNSRLQARGKRYTSTGSYQRYQCQQCKGWPSGGKRIDSTDIRGG